MNRILMALMVAAFFCSTILAQQTTTILKDSIKGRVTIIKAEPSKKGSSITVSSADNDSISAVEFTDTPDDSTYVSDDSNSSSDFDGDFNFLTNINKWFSGALTLIVVVLIFTLFFPLFAVFMAFYFRYRSRKARYRVMEQALAAGQPIPDEILKESMNIDTRSKGIKNTCLGIGLFIFLWALTSNFAVGCIGLLIMFTGIGQYLAARNQHPTDGPK